MTNRRHIAVFAVTAVITPALIVAAVLWHVFAKQIDSSHEKRLRASLQTFELLLRERQRDLKDSLSKLAADNTVRVTMDLDIRPQLERYLHTQFAVSNLDFVRAADKEGTLLAAAGDAWDDDQGGPRCAGGASGPRNLLANAGGILYLSRSVPMRSQDRTLGFLCGGIAITGSAVVDALKPQLGGVPVVARHGETPSVEGMTVGLPTGHPPGDMFDLRVAQERFRGVHTTTAIGDEELSIGVLIRISDLREGMDRAVIAIAATLVAVIAITAFALRMLGLRRRAEAQLQRERERAVVTLASIADGVVTTDNEGKIVYLNPAAEEMIGRSYDDVAGFNWKQALEIRIEGTGERVTAPSSGASSAINDHGLTTDTVLVRSDGKRTSVHFSAAPVSQENSRSGLVMVFRDMGPERDLRRRLAWKASRDDLTGLLNRTEFRHSVAQAIIDARDRDVEHGLIYIDLDEFKIVNDSCGHAIGDELLRQISSLLRSHSRASDTVARLGGDEFGVLLTGCPSERTLELARGLLDSINDHRFVQKGRVFQIGASIGVVTINNQTQDLEDLMASVDAACYAAKEQGRNRVFVGRVDDGRIAQRMEELRHASQIRQALREERFVLYQQAIVATGDPAPDKVRHREILVRMLDRAGGLVPPGAFIPVAERNGLMQEVDRWIIRHLFTVEGDRLRGVTPADGFVYTINLSGASLVDGDFLEFVQEQLTEHGISGSAIAFEITETQVITHLDKAIEFISDLKKTGVRFLLDDFGSGMSSFGYLKSLPVDYLKIDGLFVKDMTTDPIDRSMVRAINEIGHEMGLQTVAEFVENDAILDALKELGVDLAQGYGIEAPKPLSSSLRHLENRGAVENLQSQVSRFPAA
jgi:diguanylate cyclase (GGDEF)-like protein/PAS domain S-box-containing protein